MRQLLLFGTVKACFSSAHICPPRPSTSTPKRQQVDGTKCAARLPIAGHQSASNLTATCPLRRLRNSTCKLSRKVPEPTPADHLLPWTLIDGRHPIRPNLSECTTILNRLQRERLRTYEWDTCRGHRNCGQELSLTSPAHPSLMAPTMAPRPLLLLEQRAG